jgi:hypothetical protein
MIHESLTISDTPRISANQLGEFVFASEAKKLRILRDQKFGNINSAPYYACAIAAARRSLVDGRFSEAILMEEADALANREAETPRQRTKWENNALALRKLSEIALESSPAIGTHRTVARNAQVSIDGVNISVLPEVVTENLSAGSISFTKLRFSKSKIAADVSEIVLLVLHYYGLTQTRPGLAFNFSLSKVIDCFSKTVIAGHAIGRHRDHQLHLALAEIRWRWSRICPA